MIDLPAFTAGTDKQIAYAERIRSAAISSMIGGRALTAEQEAGLHAQFAPHTDAAKWIDACHKHEAVISDAGMRNAKAVLTTIVTGV